MNYRNGKVIRKTYVHHNNRYPLLESTLPIIFRHIGRSEQLHCDTMISKNRGHTVLNGIVMVQYKISYRFGSETSNAVFATDFILERIWCHIISMIVE